MALEEPEKRRNDADAKRYKLQITAPCYYYGLTLCLATQSAYRQPLLLSAAQWRRHPEEPAEERRNGAGGGAMTANWRLEVSCCYRPLDDTKQHHHGVI